MSNTQPAPFDPQKRQDAASSPIGSPRHFVLACIGLVSLLAEEGPALLEQSIQRGALVLERMQTGANPGSRQASSPRARYGLQQALTQRGWPTRGDYNSLLQQVNTLEQEINRLLEQRAASK